MESVARRLRVIQGPNANGVFELPAVGTVEVGRGKDTFTRLKDLTVSKRHCRLTVDCSRVLLTNLSQFGTQVNDQPITEHELQHGDVISLGDTQLRFEDEEAVHEEMTRRPGTALDVGELKHLVGRKVDRFEVRELLAPGAASTLFLARDTAADREVLFEVLAPQDRGMLRDFPKVLQPVLALRHPNLVPLLGAGKLGMLAWVAAEHVAGEGLEKRLQAAGVGRGLDWQAALRYGLHLAAALEELHKNQAVHRAVTPHHVLITRADNQARLGALAGARAVADCPRSDTQEVLWGPNLPYMPPERAAGNQPATLAGDVYSLGAVLYALLVGRPPFEGPREADLIARIAQAEPISPREFQVTMPPAFDRAVLQALAKRPQDRPASAAELLAMLQRIGKPGESSRDQAPEGKLLVTCRCGMQLQARKQFAGTNVRCPCCGSFVLLPGKSPFLPPGEHRGPL
jgi:serine/threonine-protein kinase